MAELRLTGLTKRFGETTALDDLHLSVADGEFMVLLGPTGAGKTTTLRLIAGLERADAGEVDIGGRRVTLEPPAARDVTFVFQQYSLYPHMTAFENMAFPLRAPSRRVPEAEVRRRVTEVAEKLRISGKLDNKATALSGGEMQRVAIGRALVREPALFLMDEPLSSLDAKLRADLRLELKRIQRELGATILYVTHDQIEALTMADRIGVLCEGRLAQVGEPREVYERPRDTYVASRLGSPEMNLLPRGLVEQVLGAIPERAETVGVRTEHVRIERARGPAGQGVVELIERLGDHSRMHVDVRGRRLVVLVDPGSGLGVGDQVSIELEDPVYFDRAGVRMGDGGGQ